MEYSGPRRVPTIRSRDGGVMIVSIHPHPQAIYPVQIELTAREAMLIRHWSKSQVGTNATTRRFIAALENLILRGEPTP